MGRRYDEVTEETKRVPYKVVKGPHDDARVEIFGQGVQPAGNFRDDSSEAEDRRGRFSGREGDQGGDHGSGVFQRQPAAGDQAGRRNCGAGSAAHYQRADGSSARLRPGQEEGRNDRRVRPGRRHVRYFHPRSRRRRRRSEVDQRRHAPGRRRYRPADRGVDGRGIQARSGHRRQQRPHGDPAAEGSGGKSQDRAFAAAGDRDQSAVPDGGRFGSRSTCS